MDTGSAGGQHRLCGGALPQVPIPSGGAAQLPEDGAKPGHQERSMHCCLHLGSKPLFSPLSFESMAQRLSLMPKILPVSVH